MPMLDRWHQHLGIELFERRAVTQFTELIVELSNHAQLVLRVAARGQLLDRLCQVDGADDVSRDQAPPPANEQAFRERGHRAEYKVVWRVASVTAQGGDRRSVG